MYIFAVVLLLTCFTYVAGQVIIPEHCSENHTFTVDHFEQSRTRYVMYFHLNDNKQKIMGYTGNIVQQLPTVIVEVNNITMPAQKLLMSNEFHFDPNNLYYVKNSTHARLAGATHIWLGCPQPLCLMADADGITFYNNQYTVFRREYYWNFTAGHVPHARAANKHCISNVEAVAFDPSANRTFIFKSHVRCTLEQCDLNDCQPVNLRGFSVAYVTAADYLNNDLFICVSSDFFFGTQTGQMLRGFENIESAFAYQGSLYVVKGEIATSISIRSTGMAQGQSTMRLYKDLFSCPNDMYKFMGYSSVTDFQKFWQKHQNWFNIGDLQMPATSTIGSSAPAGSAEALTRRSVTVNPFTLAESPKESVDILKFVIIGLLFVGLLLTIFLVTLLTGVNTWINTRVMRAIGRQARSRSTSKSRRPRKEKPAAKQPHKPSRPKQSTRSPSTSLVLSSKSKASTSPAKSRSKYNSRPVSQAATRTGSLAL